MPTNSYIELLQAGRKNARKQYVLSKTKKEKIQWLTSSEQYLIMIHQERMKHEKV